MTLFFVLEAVCNLEPIVKCFRASCDEIDPIVRRHAGREHCEGAVYREASGTAKTLFVERVCLDVFISTLSSLFGFSDWMHGCGSKAREEAPFNFVPVEFLTGNFVGVPFDGIVGKECGKVASFVAIVEVGVEVFVNCEPRWSS